LNTTPYLKSLKNEKFFSYSKGISSAVRTGVSIPLFFNAIREPFNVKEFKKKNFNMFTIAKSQGYKSIALLSQGMHTFKDVGMIDVNEFISPNDDEDLLIKLSEIKDTSKKLIVINLRNIHAPYDQFHQIEFDESTGDRITDSYLKALRYHDDWIQRCVHIIHEKIDKDAVIIFTSDHGELVNEEGMYGHNILHKLVSDVPVWVIGPENLAIHTWMKDKDYLSHYELSCQVLNLLGVQLINENDDCNTYYVQGVNLLSGSHLVYQKTNKTLEFTKTRGLDYVFYGYFNKILFALTGKGWEGNR
jgi:glucan phosphoethanolaminetransferase (alkaline phosphatase superfamily)